MAAVVINQINHSRFEVVEYIKRLRNVGVTQEVAEVQAQELAHVLEIAINSAKEELHSKELATKSDVENAKLALQNNLGTLQNDLENTKLVFRKDLENTKLELHKEIAELRYATLKFIVWSGCGVSTVIIGATYSMLKLMLH